MPRFGAAQSDLTCDASKDSAEARWPPPYQRSRCESAAVAGEPSPQRLEFARTLQGRMPCYQGPGFCLRAARPAESPAGGRSECKCAGAVLRPQRQLVPGIKYLEMKTPHIITLYIETVFTMLHLGVGSSCLALDSSDEEFSCIEWRLAEHST